MLHRLIIMRHAKSSWDTDAPTDHERPLNKRGRRDAPRIAEELVRLSWVPDLVLSSDSTRTRETFQRMADVFGELPARFLPEFYHGGLTEIRPAVAELHSEIGTVLVLGHNPGWEDAASRLSDEPISMTTANAALLGITAASWADALAAVGDWSLDRLLRPKELD